MPYIVLLPTASHHTAGAHQSRAGVWVPPATAVLFLSQALCFLKRVLSCNKTTPFPADIPVSEQTPSSFLFSSGTDASCHRVTPFSQEGTRSVMKWSLFLSQRLAKLQCSTEAAARTYSPRDSLRTACGEHFACQRRLENHLHVSSDASVRGQKSEDCC